MTNENETSAMADPSYIKDIFGEDSYFGPDEKAIRFSGVPAEEDPPSIDFKNEGLTLRADPPGATILCTLPLPNASHVRISDRNGAHIAEFTVHIPEGSNATTETIELSSGLYWSWWRAQKLNGVTP